MLKRSQILLTLTFVTACGVAYGQRGGRGFDPGRMFDRFDTNQNGTLDPEELTENQMTKRQLEDAGIDTTQPITKEQFNGVVGQRRGGRNGSGGFGPGGTSPGGGGNGGGPGSFGPGGPGRQSRGPRNQEPQPNQPSTTTLTAVTPTVAPRVFRGPAGVTPKIFRATVTFPTLPGEYANFDRDKDGQIGLYEWPRYDFAKFASLDTNSDGFLIPTELGGKIVVGGIMNPTAKPVANATPKAPATPGSETPAAPATPAQEEDTDGDQDSTNENPATPNAAPERRVVTPVDPVLRRAEDSFRLMDINRDNQISPEEFARSRSVRPAFERADIDISKPIGKEAFIEGFRKAFPN